MKKLLLILLCLPLMTLGQNVNIPDANFKAYLILYQGINTNGDTEIQVSEAAAFNVTLYCISLNISDLTGIEAFTAITGLWCHSNQLTSLDVSNNTALTFLDCGNNQLTSLDVSGATALTHLDCGNNQLTSLDVSNNTALTWLECPFNQLTSLDVSNNTDIFYLYCQQNQLTSLDVSNNTDLTFWFCDNNQLTSLDVRNGKNTTMNFSASINATLSCISVDDAAYSTANWTVANGDIDPQHYFSNNCPPPSAIQEHSTNKELLKITDLLGRETKETNQPLFYIYNDGTVEKRIVIE